MKQNQLDNLETKISYKFKNRKLLLEALTHRSYLNEHPSSKIRDNERLEFLGDAVMDLITSEYIYLSMKKSNEGELSKIKSQIISEIIFSTISKELELGKYIFLSNGECLSGGRKRNSILGDVFEALVGAIFLDSDYMTTKEVVLELIKDKIDNIDKIDEILDYKTELQELSQLRFKLVPTYEIISENGPDHDKTFEIGVYINKKVMGIAKARSKKMAEKKAAKIALLKLKR